MAWSARQLGRHILICILLSVGSSIALGGRYEDFTRKAAQGSKLKVIGATYFGAGGVEEFIGAGGFSDGSIVAFGNSWGPSFSSQPGPLLLGKGRHLGLNPYLPDANTNKSVAGAKDEKKLRSDDPDMAGVIVFYSPGLRAIRKIVRFDWGVASISAGAVARDEKSIFIAGRCTSSFPSALHGRLKTEAAGSEKGRGPYEYDRVKVSGDVYIARLPASGDGILWAVVFSGARTAPDQLWIDYEGNVYADIHGLVRISADGHSVAHLQIIGPTGARILTSTRTAHYLAVDPRNGSFYFGGDRNTDTGKQGWRQPYLYKFAPDGRKLWTLWEWPPNQCACGDDGNGLCADSTPRVIDIGPDGTLVVGGWSSGGNSVFTRQTDSLSEPVRAKGFGMDASGLRGASSLSYILKINPQTRKLENETMFLAYLPMSMKKAKYRGVPNFTSLHHIAAAADGSIAFTGSAATGLIQTPNAFYKYPDDGSGYGGEFVAVFDKEFDNLLFSSYLPGCDHATVSTAGNRVIVVSRSKGSDEKMPPTSSPIFNAIQKQKNADLNAHILLLGPDDSN